MKVFLSWSGDKSREVALILSDWLPNVMQWVKPFMSAEDIKKGARWSADLAKELEDTNFGIICVTPDNLNAPWIAFEAGSLAKMINESRVAPLIFQMKPSDISGPLLQFQATMFNRDEVKNLLWSINSAATDEEKLLEPRFEKAFETWWPELEDQISRITFEQAIDSAKTASKKSTRSDVSKKTENILEELLVLARSQTKILHSPEDLFPRQYFVWSYVNFRVCRECPE